MFDKKKYEVEYRQRHKARFQEFRKKYYQKHKKQNLNIFKYIKVKCPQCGTMFIKNQHSQINCKECGRPKSKKAIEAGLRKIARTKWYGCPLYIRIKKDKQHERNEKYNYTHKSEIAECRRQYKRPPLSPIQLERRNKQRREKRAKDIQIRKKIKEKIRKIKERNHRLFLIKKEKDKITKKLLSIEKRKERDRIRAWINYRLNKPKMLEKKRLIHVYKTVKVLPLCKKVSAIERALRHNGLDAQMLNHISEGATHEAYI